MIAAHEVTSSSALSPEQLEGIMLRISIRTLERRAATGQPVVLSPEFTRELAEYLRRLQQGAV